MDIPLLNILEQELLAKLQLLQLTKKKKEQDQENKSYCVICLDEKREHVLVPCGHLCICSSCSGPFSKTQPHICPVCRAPFTATYKVYY
uniref:RING-type domain-containing protein n=1 Tax=Arcella intermedia TaxID=1963864 RepID=A0A6B2LQ64_9EUKA